MKNLTIHHDFNLGLKLYTIPDFFRNKIQNVYTFLNFKNIKDEANLNSVIVFFGNRIKTNDIKQMKNLKWIHLGSVGSDSINIKYFKKRKIIFTNSKGLMTDSIVEHALNFITSFSRGMNYINILRNKNNLSRESFDQYFDQISNLSNKKILICGFGEGGQKLGNILSCLNLDIYTISKTKKHKFKNYNLGSLNEIIPKMNFIVNLLPLNEETKSLFDKKVFHHMSNAYFINLGRGKTVVEKDLIDAIKKGNIKSAALDVFEEEPLKSNSELLNIDDLIITPHVAGLSTNYWHGQLNLFSYNLEVFLSEETDKKMKNLILK